MFCRGALAGDVVWIDVANTRKNRVVSEIQGLHVARWRVYIQTHGLMVPRCVDPLPTGGELAVSVGAEKRRVYKPTRGTGFDAVICEVTKSSSASDVDANPCSHSANHPIQNHARSKKRVTMDRVVLPFQRRAAGAASSNASRPSWRLH